jgi:predicted N-acetyltransferase YhbS
MSHYRAATEDDAAALLHVRNAALTALAPVPYTSDVIQAWCLLPLQVDVQDGVALVAEEAGQVVGYGWRVASHLRELYVLPSHWRRGHGAELLRRLEASSTAHGAALELQATLSARAFYERRGYQAIAEAELWLNVEQHARVVWMRKPRG